MQNSEKCAYVNAAGSKILLYPLIKHHQIHLYK